MPGMTRPMTGCGTIAVEATKRARSKPGSIATQAQRDRLGACVGRKEETREEANQSQIIRDIVDVTPERCCKRVSATEAVVQLMHLHGLPCRIGESIEQLFMFLLEP